MSDDLRELFARDPLKLSDQDLMTIIEYEREQRRHFNLTGKAPAKKATSKKSAKSAAIDEIASKIDLEDL